MLNDIAESVATEIKGLNKPERYGPRFSLSGARQLLIYVGTKAMRSASMANVVASVPVFKIIKDKSDMSESVRHT